MLPAEVATWYKEVFGEDYYLEIQDHGSQEDRIVNVEIVKIARELNIKIVPPMILTIFPATT
jgi:DNA polymerase-3 subunit alpha